MSKRTVLNVCKYLLAAGLMTYVIWSNWGYPERVADRVVPGFVTQLPTDNRPPSAFRRFLGRIVALLGESEPNRTRPPTVAGKVIAYLPGESIAIEETRPDHPGKGTMAEFRLVPDKSKVGVGDAGVIEPGETVSVWQHPPGLAFVWRKHVVQGEPVRWGYFVLATMLMVGAMLLTFMRWFLLVRAQDLPFRVPDAIRLGFIGTFFNTFMPGSVGGDVIKAAFLAREQDRRTAAVSTVIMDRAIALWALVWFVAICGVFFWALGLLHGEGARECRLIVKVALIVVVLSLGVWILLGLLSPFRAERFAWRLGRLPKVGHAAAEFWRAVWTYRCRQRSVAATMLISWVGHVGFVLVFYCCAQVLRDPADPLQTIPTLAQHFLIVPIGLVIQAIPGFPGGAGIGELGFGALYLWLGASETCGVLGSLVQRVINWLLSIFGYFVYRRMRPGLRPAVEAERAALAVGQNGHRSADAEVHVRVRNPG